MPSTRQTTAGLNQLIPVVGRNRVRFIKELGPRATGELLTLFMAHVSETLEQIRQVDDCIELAELGRIAHVMKGTAGCYGANQLSEMSCCLNKACQSNDHRAATVLLGPFITQCERTITFYEEIARICQTLH